jgi:hypothetical protein
MLILRLVTEEPDFTPPRLHVSAGARFQWNVRESSSLNASMLLEHGGGC